MLHLQDEQIEYLTLVSEAAHDRADDMMHNEAKEQAHKVYNAIGVLDAILKPETPYSVKVIAEYQPIEVQDHDDGEYRHKKSIIRLAFIDDNPEQMLAEAEYAVTFTDPHWCNLESDSDVEISIKTIKSPRPAATDQYADPINVIAIKQQMFQYATNLYRTMLSFFDCDAIGAFEMICHEPKTITIAIENVDYPL
jgi:hypothetical protein